MIDAKFSILLAYMLASVYLFFLVLTGRLLPFPGMMATSLFAVVYGLLSIILIWSITNLPFYSFPILFLIATYFYTFSVFILYPLDGANAFNSMSRSVVHIPLILQGVPIILLAISAFTLSATVTSLRAPQANRESVHSKSPSHLQENIDKFLREFAWLIYCIFFGFIIYHTARGSGLATAYSNAYIGNNNGFAALQTAGLMPRTVTAALSWFLPISSVILLATHKTRRELIHSIMATIVFCAIALVAGDRTAPSVLILFIPGILTLKGFHVKASVVLAVVAAAGLIVITWSAVRGVPVRNWTPRLFIDTLEQRLPGGEKSVYNTPFGVTLSEFSGSYQTLVGTLLFVPEREAFRFGSDYVNSVAIAIPFAASKISFVDAQDKPAQWIEQVLGYKEFGGFGYLQVAEAYLQFGAFGVLGLYLLLGFLLPRIWWKCNELNELHMLSFLFVVIYAILVWIRNDVYVFTRLVIWSFVITVVIPTIHINIPDPTSNRRRRPVIRGNAERRL